MREVGSFEVKNKLSALLDLVESGEEVVITRHGKAVARLVPEDRRVRRAKAQAAADRIRARAKGVALGDLRIKDLINEGRK